MISSRRLSIYQLVTPNIDSYAAFSIASVLKYAQKHNYGFHIQREKLEMDMHINWTKISLLQMAAETSDGYSLLIDADTVLVNQSFALGNWMDSLTEKKSILMTKDTPLFKRNRPNAGVILFKNAEGKKIMDYWMHAAKNEGSHLADTHPRNQRVYWNYVQPKYHDEQVLVSNAYATKYHWFVPYVPSSQRFLFHFTQSDADIRTKTMELMYDKYIDDSALLSKIRKQLEENQTGLIRLN